MDWNGLNEEQTLAAMRRWMAAGGDARRFPRTEDEVAMPTLRRARLLAPNNKGFPSQVRDRLAVCGPWFVDGELPTGPSLAVVGSRAVSHEGSRICRELVSEVAREGVCIVSGGAIGVDSIAHEAALRAGAQTVAFLPSALDCLTPTRNRALFERITEQGALVTEYPPGVSARKHHFFRRNELIATFADLVLVVRAKENSGTMLTAEAALRYGTSICAVPGSPEDATSEGCNDLIRRGAVCVTRPEHILELLDMQAQATLPLTPAKPALSPLAARLFDVIEEIPRSHDELCEELPAHEVLAALTELEVTGCVELTDGRWQVRATLRRERG